MKRDDHHEDGISVEASDGGEQRWARDFRDACGFAERFARRLLQRHEPLDVAGAMTGAAITVLVSAFGKQDAVAYLHDLALQLEREGDPATRFN